MKRLKLLAILLVLAMVATACGGDGDGSETTPASDGGNVYEGLTVVVSTTIWGDVVRNVTGDAADVEVLFPIGADPHDYQLSAAQAALMQEADLVIVNGLTLEEGLSDVVEGLEADGVNVLEVAGLLQPIPFGDSGHDDHGDEESHDDHGNEEDQEHADEERHDDSHEHGDEDPHVWMDPLRVAEAAQLIAEELARLDSSVDWMGNASAYADRLRALDAEIVSMLSAVPVERRKLVTNHEALGYFAERYEFELVGTVIPGGSTLADPSSAELAEIVETLVDESIDVIFAETIDPSVLAEALADEVEGVVVVELYTGSLGAPGSEAETYLDLLRTDASRIADALS